jgi:transposase
MLYRWRMEYNNGELKANKHMKPQKPSPKRLPNKAVPIVKQDDELKQALKRIKQLERELEYKTEELDLLKKAERFLAQRAKK